MNRINGPSTALLLSLSLTFSSASALELTARQVNVGAQLTMAAAQTVAEKLFKLDAAGTEPIILVIGTRGGYAPAAMVVVDAINATRSKVYGLIQSEAFGAGALVAAFCDRRYAFPHASFLFRRPSPCPRAPSSHGRLECPPDPSPEARLLALQALRDRGLVTAEEFAVKRKEIIDSIRL